MERRLAAILAADVVGYSRQIWADRFDQMGDMFVTRPRHGRRENAHDRDARRV
jgi:hypothetical protein